MLSFHLRMIVFFPAWPGVFEKTDPGDGKPASLASSINLIAIRVEYWKTHLLTWSTIEKHITSELSRTFYLSQFSKNSFTIPQVLNQPENLKQMRILRELKTERRLIFFKSIKY